MRTDGRRALADPPPVSGTTAEAFHPAVSPANSVKRRVLLVDDSGAYRRALRLVIESIGDIEVAEAESGEQAIALIPEARPQLVLMDINLPGMNGIETTARVLEFAPETVVIGLSINTDQHTSEAIRNAGAAMLVNKESGIAMVLAVVERYL